MTENNTVKEKKTMKIIKASENLTAKDIYNLTRNPRSQKMRNAVDSRIEVDKWALYEDVNRKNGELQEVLSITTPDGEVFATNSPTFKDDFVDMQELFTEMGETVHAITVITGTSKSGREFVTCVYCD